MAIRNSYKNTLKSMETKNIYCIASICPARNHKTKGQGQYYMLNANEKGLMKIEMKIFNEKKI